MHQPVTDNPFVIMVINMVIVFAVLTAVWGLIELVHLIDPTKKKEVSAAPPQAAAAPAAPVMAAAPAAADEGVSAETIAVIAAAVAACGCSPAQIKAVRPAVWKTTRCAHLRLHSRPSAVQRTFDTPVCRLRANRNPVPSLSLSPPYFAASDRCPARPAQRTTRKGQTL